MARKSGKQQHQASPRPATVVANESSVTLAAAYLRLSSDDKKKRGDSIETQRNIIENFINSSPDIILHKTYIDINTTGTNFERPEFQRMLEDAKNGEINCIVVKDLTRFGRNAIDTGYYLEKELPAMNIRFIAVTDSYDSIDGDGGMLLPLKNFISESYALDISRKCRAVQKQKINDGKYVGRLAPYGYRKSAKDRLKLEIDPETAPVVRKIFEMAYNGAGASEIARTLTTEGVIPPSNYKLEEQRCRWLCRRAGCLTRFSCEGI